jgi:hypothetical protein
MAMAMAVKHRDRNRVGTYQNERPYFSAISQVHRHQFSCTIAAVSMHLDQKHVIAMEYTITYSRTETEGLEAKIGGTVS